MVILYQTDIADFVKIKDKYIVWELTKIQGKNCKHMKGVFKHRQVGGIELVSSASCSITTHWFHKYTQIQMDKKT